MERDSNVHALFAVNAPILGKKKVVWLSSTAHPLIFENWKKVFTVQKYTAPNFQNSKKKKVFFSSSLRILNFQKYFLSCCCQLAYILILV